MMLSMTKQAQKALAELDAKQYRQVGSAVFGLLSNPAPHDSRPMKGAQRGECRVDVGEYRIIYSVSEDRIEVLVIGKRNDDEVYKIWERMK
jgi:mRNA interferase RelE/StbE